MKKENIYLDLRKLSEEEIKSIPSIIKRHSDIIDELLEQDLMLGVSDRTYPYLVYKDYTGYVGINGFEWTQLRSASGKTEITFQDFKKLFRDYEKEVFEMLVAVTNDYHNGLPVDIDKIEQLIKEVEAR